MTLKNLIKSIDSWKNKTVTELTTILNSETVEVRDDQMYTWAGVALAIGSENADNLRKFMEANGLGWAVHQLGGSGIQLSHQSTQLMLSTLISAGVVGADVLKAIGIYYISPYVNDNNEGLVTEEIVQSEIDNILLEEKNNSLRQRIINASALANERLVNATEDQYLVVWNQCWEDSI